MKQDPGTTELPSPHTPHPVQTCGVHVTGERLAQCRTRLETSGMSQRAARRVGLTPRESTERFGQN
jgi:hypothetical protein